MTRRLRTKRTATRAYSPTSGTATVFGLDAWQEAGAIHPGLAYVPSEANLWPGLSGAEVLGYIGSVHGSVEVGYRAPLVEMFELEVAGIVIPSCEGGSFARTSIPIPENWSLEDQV